MTGTNVISDQELELAHLIVGTLNLDFDLHAIEPEIPLYEAGFGLDSIDILEVALAISQRYGVKLRSDDKNNVDIFKSLQALSQYVQQHRTK
ncbi:MAG TPA: phosphopantetheine-binding protein [Aliidongia sp.]|nr:phosphopantetheine-binding protein [Aliidongia sp.]